MRKSLLVLSLALFAHASACQKSAAPVAPRGAAAKVAPNGPGALELSKEASAKIKAAQEKLTSDYVPRTKHKEGQTPHFTNRLITQTSPYLRQHAHNPVNWFPWGEEAFATAQKLNRPVFLSVGYSTCHWCHVMEEESFEDLEIARYLNENYVAIKLDREERPDIDAVYMQAVRLLTRGGGWPMSVWLTPAKEPFMAGTYFQAREGDRYPRKGFLTLLKELKARFDQDPQSVAQEAQELSQNIYAQLSRGAPGVVDYTKTLDHAFRFYEGAFDPQVGGLDRRRKFPSSLPIMVLWREFRRTKNPKALAMATLTLEKMSEGGLYDHIGGGFHRYTVDPRWQVPHFEKMLYDNALLVPAYLEGHRLTKDPRFLKVAKETLDYVLREMTHAEGAFFSATDADSPISNESEEREEGLFFTFTPSEIDALLSPAQANLIKKYYNVTEAGNFEGRSVLHVNQHLNTLAKAQKKTPAALSNELEAAKAALYNERLKRAPPLRDDKILSGWNALMISAFALGAGQSGDERYLSAAQDAASFLLTKLYVGNPKRLERSYKDENTSGKAFLDDHAFLIAALLDLFESDSDPKWLNAAYALERDVERYFRDKNGGYFRTASDAESLLVREKPKFDNAIPTGNSVHALNLLRLYALSADDEFRLKADALFAAFGNALTRQPAALSRMLWAVDFAAEKTRQIVIAIPEPRERQKLDAQSLEMLGVLSDVYVPNSVRFALTPNTRAALEKVTPLATAKVARQNKVTVYVCEDQVCQLPTTKPDQVRKMLEALRYEN